MQNVYIAAADVAEEALEHVTANQQHNKHGKILLFNLPGLGELEHSGLPTIRSLHD